ncbi:uncharacterized protein LOC105442431 [Strongylocentrotus purpuratus]|uniref:Uncharacterized protein n=1 Tax=Strongylocentrotus purpuratus TaxID=7668 RepID=A0A7M7P9R6_STRPU|nr:uncharacterized protein LOC105442431 [Strongylocentrotus purpuratus]
MTVKLWSCLRSFNSLNHLNISDSYLSFPPYPPELPSVLKLSAEKVTSQSYKGVISSLPRLRVIDITIDDAERDIPQIMAGLRRSYTGGQRLAYIKLTAPSSLPLEKKRVRSETLKKLGLLIREQTKNLQRLDLLGVKGTGEEDLVNLIESCRLVKSMSFVLLESCRTTEGGLLEFHLKDLQTSSGDLSVLVYHDDKLQDEKSYSISHIG